MLTGLVLPAAQVERRLPEHEVRHQIGLRDRGPVPVRQGEPRSTHRPGNRRHDRNLFTPVDRGDPVLGDDVQLGVEIGRAEVPDAALDHVEVAVDEIADPQLVAAAQHP